MLKVGEFSRLGYVTVRALRLYDDLGLLKPAHVDASTGYRYYSLEQLPRLNRILALKELGLDLEQIRRMLDLPLSLEAVRGMLQLKQAELEQQLDRTQLQLDRLNLRLRQMEQEGRPEPLLDVHLKPLPALNVASIRAVVPHVDQVGLYCNAHFTLLAGWLGAAGMALGQTINLYYAEEYHEEQIEMESAVVLEHRPSTTPPPGVTLGRLEPVAHAAVMTLETRMGDLPLAIADLLAWVSKSELTPVGPLREVHHFEDPTALCWDDRRVVELQVPVSPKG